MPLVSATVISSSSSIFCVASACQRPIPLKLSYSSPSPGIVGVMRLTHLPLRPVTVGSREESGPSGRRPFFRTPNHSPRKAMDDRKKKSHWASDDFKIPKKTRSAVTTPPMPAPYTQLTPPHTYHV